MAQLIDFETRRLLDAVQHKAVQPKLDFPSEFHLTMDLNPNHSAPGNEVLLQAAIEERRREIFRRAQNLRFDTWGERIEGMSFQDFDDAREIFRSPKTDLELLECMENFTVRADRVYEEPEKNRIVIIIGSDNEYYVNWDILRTYGQKDRYFSHQ